MTATIYDVARKAGTGIGTVSRAMNNHPNVSAATRKRVLDVAHELNYKPHRVAQSLACKKTHTVASVVPFFFNYFYMNLLKHIQHLLALHHYDLVLYSVDELDNTHSVFDKVLNERKADGIFIISLPVDQDYALRFKRNNVPVMMLDHINEQLDSIIIGSREGARTATQYLIDLGHRHLGMINGDLQSYPARARLDGFRQALADNDMQCEKNHVLFCDAFIGEHGFNEVAGYEAMNRLLKQSNEHPSALFVASDIQALGAMRAAREKGIRIPEDIAFVGFDDIAFSRSVGLTTMRQPLLQMAELAVDRLLRHLDDFRTEERYQVVLDPDLIVRETSGCSRTVFEKSASTSRI